MSSLARTSISAVAEWEFAVWELWGDNSQMNTIEVAVHATASTRMVLGFNHLLAACQFASSVVKLETQFAGQEFGGFWEEIFHNALAVVVLSVSSLEAFANELYFEEGVFPPVVNATVSDVITDIVDDKPILDKYMFALALRAGKNLKKGSPTVQAVSALIRLRNGVVHFRSEWFGKQKAHDKLSKQLLGMFDPSPFLSGEPVFPRAWASGSFAFWAVRSVVHFLDHFHREASLPCPLDPFRGRIEQILGEPLMAKSR